MAVYGYYCASSAIGLLVSAAFANALPEAVYGTYRFVFAVGGTFQVFLWSGMGNAVMRAAARGEGAFLREAVRFRMLWGLPTYGICVGAIGIIYGIRMPESGMGISLLILAIAAPIIGAYSTYQSYLQGKKAFRKYAIWGTAGEAAVAATTLATLAIRPEIATLVAVYAISQMIVNMALYGRTVTLYPPHGKETESHLRYGQHLTAMEFLGTIAQQADRLIMFHFWGAGALARYAVLQMVPQYAYAALKSTGTVIMPALSGRSRTSVRKMFYPAIGALGTCGIVLGGAYALMMPGILPMMFPAYAEYAGYAGIFGIDIALALPMSFIGSAITAQKLVKGAYASNMISSALKIVLYAALGIQGGVAGIVLAHVIGRIAGFIVNIAAWEYEMRYSPDRSGDGTRNA